MPGIAESVDEKTCPCFLFDTRTDSVVPIRITPPYGAKITACPGTGRNGIITKTAVTPARDRMNRPRFDFLP